MLGSAFHALHQHRTLLHPSGWRFPKATRLLVAETGYGLSRPVVNLAQMCAVGAAGALEFVVITLHCLSSSRERAALCVLPAYGKGTFADRCSSREMTSRGSG